MGQWVGVLVFCVVECYWVSSYRCVNILCGGNYNWLNYCRSSVAFPVDIP